MRYINSRFTYLLTYTPASVTFILSIDGNDGMSLYNAIHFSVYFIAERLNTKQRTYSLTEKNGSSKAMFTKTP